MRLTQLLVTTGTMCSNIILQDKAYGTLIRGPAPFCRAYSFCGISFRSVPVRSGHLWDRYNTLAVRLLTADAHVPQWQNAHLI